MTKKVKAKIRTRKNRIYVSELDVLNQESEARQEVSLLALRTKSIVMPIPLKRKRQKVETKNQKRKKIISSSLYPSKWVPCTITTKRKNKKKKFETWFKWSPIVACAVHSQSFNILYEDCFGCTKWQAYMTDTKKKRQKIRVPIITKRSAL